MVAVTEPHDGRRNPARQRSLRAQPERVGAGHLRVGVRRAQVDVDEVPLSHVDRAVATLQPHRAAGAAKQSPDDGFEPERLLQECRPGVAVPFPEPGQQLGVLQEVPGAHADQLTRRHHPRGTVGDRLGEDLQVAEPLVQGCADEVVPRVLAVRADRGFDVLPVEPERRRVGPQQARQCADRERGGQRVAVEEGVEPLGHAGQRGVGEADDAADHLDRHPHGEVGEVRAAVLPNLSREAFGQLLHHRPVGLDRLGGEERRRGAALGAMVGAVEVEDRRPHGALRPHGVGAEPGLAVPVLVAQDLPRQLEGADHDPRPVGADHAFDVRSGRGLAGRRQLPDRAPSRDGIHERRRYPCRPSVTPRSRIAPHTARGRTSGRALGAGSRRHSTRRSPACDRWCARRP